MNRQVSGVSPNSRRPSTTRDAGSSGRPERVEGRDSAQRLLTIVDRRAAITRAIELAKAGDVVLVAGKGHEKYQVIGGQTLPFDDVEVAREALTRRRTKSGVAK